MKDDYIVRSRRHRKRRGRRGYRDLDDETYKKKKRFREIIIFLIEILLCILLAYCIIAFGVEKMTIVGDSMAPTLEDGNQIIINKMEYRFKQPKRFDVVVFRQSGKEHGYYICKRIIGMPNETVQIKNGLVYINDNPLEEKIYVDLCMNGGIAEEAITLEENEYFVLGDNRNNSEDSRFANVGNILSDEIIGKAWIRLKPFDFVNAIQVEKDSVEEGDTESEENDIETEE